MPCTAITPIPISELHSGNLLQSPFWAAFKARGGWQPKAFRWRTDTLDGILLVLLRAFPGGLHLAYAPRGPSVPAQFTAKETTEFLSSLAHELKSHLSPGCFVIRFDLGGGTFGPVGTDIAVPEPLAPPLCKAPCRVQPPDTVILPLPQKNNNEETLLAAMHKKTRYNIRLAARKGVIVRRLEGKEALEALPRWYELYRQTAQRDGIALHHAAYYRNLFQEAENFSPSDLRLSLYMAGHGGECLAGIIVSLYERRAAYMYGASASHKRELMPSYLLQWQAIQDAAAAGCTEYDLFGIPPNDDPSHPMHGLWRFKTGFGGNIHHYRGAWDSPLKPVIYHLYAAAEKLRGHIATSRKKLAALRKMEKTKFAS